MIYEMMFGFNPFNKENKDLSNEEYKKKID